MSVIFNKIEQYYCNNLPFVVYRKPNTNKVNAYFLEDKQLQYTSDFKESGFVFAPFNNKEKSILFLRDKADVFSETILTDEEFLKSQYSLKEVGKDKHVLLVKKAINILENNDLFKVVLSRKEQHNLKNFNILSTFKRLLHLYNNAFVYIWFHPKVGLWFGATPETLLEITGKSFTTMSLAGTQIYKDNKNLIWKSKELEEQQMVTNFIQEALQPIASKITINNKETVKAGNLAHLRTHISGVLNSNASLLSLIRDLHPTPAICGLPRTEAESFILNNEGYNRNFYTGFLGEINSIKSKTNQVSSNLFVNLRCMEIAKNVAYIYVGGGITKGSNAEKEWEETVSKTKTMKSVL